MTRIVVFTGNPAYSVRKGIVEIDAALPGLQWLVLVHSPQRTPGLLLRNQWRNLQRNGWRWIPYQLADLARRLVHRADGHGAGQPPELPGAAYTEQAFECRANLRLLRVDDIHGAEALAAVQGFAPDVGLSLAAPILKRALFALPRLGTINLHKGKLPSYRGMPPGFWELWHDEQQVGCSVHVVDDKLDTGALLREDVVPRARYATLRGLQLALDEMGVALTREVVVELLAGRLSGVAQTGAGRTFRKPTLAQQSALARRMARIQPVLAPWPVRLARDAAAALMWHAWRAGLHRVLAPRVTVVLYHRVSDDARDNLTVGIEQFERQMALLARHCRPVSLQQVLAMERVPRSDRPLVAVTFDDGYRDNATNAAPILQRHGIPAAFFVSTGIVGSTRPFPHDVRRGNAAIANMSWDDIRSLHRQGFEIGSHSVNHADCAAETSAQVQVELDRSRDDLRRELGVHDLVFAYPYGGRQHMTDERLQLVRLAGYSACLSAYGGSNLRSVDRFNVLRRGIHWGFGDRAFLRQCLGWW